MEHGARGEIPGSWIADEDEAQEEANAVYDLAKDKSIRSSGSEVPKAEHLEVVRQEVESAEKYFSSMVGKMTEEEKARMLTNFVMKDSLARTAEEMDVLGAAYHRFSISGEESTRAALVNAFERFLQILSEELTNDPQMRIVCDEDPKAIEEHVKSITDELRSNFMEKLNQGRLNEIFDNSGITLN